jgi:hypothetical protein
LFVPKRLVYRLGRLLAEIIWVAAYLLAWLLPAHTQPGGLQLAAVYAPVQAVAVLAGTWIGCIVHELGHLLACRAVGAQVRAFRVGGWDRTFRFRVRGVFVSIGFPTRGQVEYRGAPAAWRRVVITVAGSAANIVVGALVVVLAALMPAGQPARPPAFAIGLGIVATGLANLMPFRTRKGRLTDGARLPELRTDLRLESQRRLLQAVQQMQRTGRAAELLKLHAGQRDPAGPLQADQAQALIAVENTVALLPELPGDTIALIERRLGLLAPMAGEGAGAALACSTLSCLRLREGQFGEAEALAQRALAAASGSPTRNTAREEFAAALTGVARQALGLPYEDVLASAAVSRSRIEIMMAQLWWAMAPERMLALAGQGDLMARVGAGSIAAYLRRAGRVAELLDLHAGIVLTRDELTAGPHAVALLDSMHVVEYNVLLLPGIPVDDIDIAAERVQFVRDHHPSRDDHHLAAIEHSLALASLRQGRHKEVRPLCRAGLDASLPADNRATVLATVALARRARGKSYRGLLTEAVFLAPDADLVQLVSQASPRQAEHVPVHTSS